MAATLDLPIHDRLVIDPDESVISDAEFDALMARFAPYERAPHLAVGVSGGPDSMALTVLADRWARARGGQVTGLTVDHGLRAASGTEAERVAAWLRSRGISHHVLRWEGPKPVAGLQAAAREKRRTLLTGWCREFGVLHLLLGHQHEDQAETWLMRRERKSGPDGLAGMAAAVELHDTRILRPLLDVPAARLRAMLKSFGQSWIEDPSNDNARFRRTHFRRLLRHDQVDPALIFVGTQDATKTRQERERARAAILARVVSIFPEGWARLDRAVLQRGGASNAALAQVLMVVGGSIYPPRRERLDRLCEALADAKFAGATLAGCRLLPRRGDILVVREFAAAKGSIPVSGPGRYRWDDRFEVAIKGKKPVQPGAYQIARLSPLGWRQVTAAAPQLGKTSLPGAVRWCLPALWDLDGVLEVPHLLYRRRGADPDSVMVVSTMFCPRQALAGPGFMAL